LQRDEASADRFCTVCCGLIRLVDAGVALQLSCGGHPLPMVGHADGTVDLVECRGTLLGLTDPVKLQDQRLVLAAGDVVVLYTDGAIEAHHAPDDLFGEERLRALVSETVSEPADGIADAILSAVVGFSPTEPKDDIAILVLKVDPVSA